MTTPWTVRVGSRKSPLAIAQSEEVVSKLRTSFPTHDFTIVRILTGGDRDKVSSLQSLGRGTFSKDIEDALLRGEVDLAVHSAKDLVPDLPDGLTLGGVLEREDPRDVLVNRWGVTLAELPASARIGTGSPRRGAQILAQRPDLHVLPIRGNVGTRLEKSRGSDYDGIVLAAAGLLRLGMQSEITEYLDPNAFTPEAGQGTIALQVRRDDAQTMEMITAIDHEPTRNSLTAERSFVDVIGGGCKVPVAAFARSEGGKFRVSAMAALPDGSKVYRIEVEDEDDDPAAAGAHAAEVLLARGARGIVEDGR
jgi:hydroxymethylbilane synthase